MKPKVLITRRVFRETLDYLESRCMVIANQSDKPFSSADLIKLLQDCSGALCALTDRIDEPVLAACPDLKVVANIAVGYNNIDLAACNARAVMVTNTPRVLDEDTADFAWALMLATARRVVEADRMVRAGEWQGWQLQQLLGIDIHGATLGIIGMGRIGQAIARRATGFDMRIIYHNRSRLSFDAERAVNASYVSKEELLRQSDVVVLQLPYSAQSHHIIGASELKQMKPSAILINSTRGGVVDDGALIAALKSETIRAAGLDVYENEPHLHPEFAALNNVVLAPHIASSSEATRRAMAMTAAHNVVAGVSGAIPPNLVNPEVTLAR